jgi:D-alanyl-D-alanine carboxypeptidase (penicillin-binding protein 5/6)
VRATNDLLGSFPGTIGVKTGFTDDAGWSQVAAARRNGVTIFAVVLGAASRADRRADLERLLEWGLERYGRLQLISTERTYATASIPFSDERLRLVAEDPATALVRVDFPFRETVVAPVMVDPPVRSGQQLGEVCTELPKGPVCRPLVAASDVDEAGFRDRAGWYAGRALDHAGGMLESVFGAIF